MTKLEEINSHLAATNINGLALLVSEMRKAQSAYFKTRSPEALQESKSLEKQVDKAVAIITSKQDNLF